MSASFTVSGKTTDVISGTSIEDAARSVGLNPDAYLFLSNGKPVPMDSKIEDNAQIRAVKVASGG